MKTGRPLQLNDREFTNIVTIATNNRGTEGSHTQQCTIHSHLYLPELLPLAETQMLWTPRPTAGGYDKALWKTGMSDGWGQNENNKMNPTHDPRFPLETAISERRECDET